MNVLSLFDGMSCGQLALQKAGIKVSNYFASEIDKYAIAVTQHRFPETVQLGDVTTIDGSQFTQIDLLIGGSPCQGFSIAGNQLNFDHPQSKLFFEYVRLLKEVKPKYFLLENVPMKKEYQDVITEHLGVEPIMINSSLLSAQNRKRLYWTNIPDVEQPEDKGLVMRNILDYSVDSTLSEKEMAYMRRLRNGKPRFEYHKSEENGKSCTLTANMYKGVPYGCIQIGEANVNGHDILKRVYSDLGKAPALNTMNGGNREPKVAVSEKFWRKLTPLECERLQTVPDNYTLVPYGNRMMSNTQRYKMLGNGWTVDVVAHILGGLK